MKDNKHRLIIWLLTFVIWICSLDIKIMIHDNHQLILEQLSWVNERLDEMYQCDKYTWQEMWTVSQCEALREEFLNHK